MTRISSRDICLHNVSSMDEGEGTRNGQRTIYAASAFQSNNYNRPFRCRYEPSYHYCFRILFLPPTKLLCLSMSLGRFCEFSTWGCINQATADDSHSQGAKQAPERRDQQWVMIAAGNGCNKVSRMESINSQTMRRQTEMKNEQRCALASFVARQKYSIFKIRLILFWGSMSSARNTAKLTATPSFNCEPRLRERTRHVP